MHSSRQVCAHDFRGEGTDPHGKYQQFAEQATGACTGSTERWEVCYPREINTRCRPALKLAHQTWLDQMHDA